MNSQSIAILSLKAISSGKSSLCNLISKFISRYIYMKNQDSILIFGSSGQIGKSLIRKFTKNNYRVTAVTKTYSSKRLSN